MKIRIIGSVGSGKTTLAKKLSEMEGISYFETDRIVWKREQIEVRRTDSEKNELLKQIINQIGSSKEYISNHGRWVASHRQISSFF